MKKNKKRKDSEGGWGGGGWRETRVILTSAVMEALGGERVQRPPQSAQLREEDDWKKVKDDTMWCRITRGPARLTLVQMLHLQKQSRKQQRKKQKKNTVPEFSANSEQFSFNVLGAKLGEIYI